LGPIPNPQSPIPKPQSPIYFNLRKIYNPKKIQLKYKFKLKKK